MDIRKYNKDKKFNALLDVDLNTNLLILQEITKKWYSARPDNEDLQLLKKAVTRVSLIANKLMYEKELYHLSISEYREDKLRAIERARRVEEELEQINKKL